MACSYGVATVRESLRGIAFNEAEVDYATVAETLAELSARAKFV